jgi:salicylate hydroxylase
MSQVVTTSRDAVAVYNFEDPELGWDLEKIGERLKDRYRWIWEVNLQEELEKARRIMLEGV